MNCYSGAPTDRIVRTLSLLVGSMRDQDKYKRASELYEATYGEQDDDQRTRRLREAIGILGGLPADELNHADALHLLGLCWYELPDVNAENLERAEQAFRSCLAAESDHQYANLYLGARTI